MRYAPQMLRGFSAWLRSPMSKGMALQTAKAVPVTVAGDYLADKAGQLTGNENVENMADVIGIVNSARKLNPYQFTLESVLTATDPDWERIARKAGRTLSDMTSTAVQARDYSPEPIDLSAQNVPLPRRQDIRFNEDFSMPRLQPRGLQGYNLNY